MRKLCADLIDDQSMLILILLPTNVLPCPALSFLSSGRPNVWYSAMDNIILLGIESQLIYFFYYWSWYIKLHLSSIVLLFVYYFAKN